MKFNYKRITALAASAIMIGSSLGIAAAANYPSPFLTGAGDVAVVVGTGTGVSVLDSVQAGNIQSDLESRYTGGGGTSTTSCVGGDCYVFELGSTKLNINATLRSIKGNSINKNELPNVLKDGTYESQYGYTQAVDINTSSTSGLTYTAFQDSDFLDKKPVIGVKVKDGAPVLIYTLAWTKQPESEKSSTNRLDDLENTQIEILGKEYTILNAYDADANSGKIKLDLMGGAVVSSVNRDESVTHTLAGSTYTIRASSIADATTDLCVSINGGAEQCKTDRKKGDTWELSDGVQMGVRSISYTSKTGTVDMVRFSLGAEKITLEDNQTIQVNGDSVTGMTVQVPYTNATKRKLGNIKIHWVANEDLFIAEGEEVVMPVFGGLKFSAGEFYSPKNEIIKVRNDGAKAIELVIPIKSGMATIPLLFGNETEYTHIGSDNNEILATSLNATLAWNSTSDGVTGLGAVNVSGNLFPWNHKGFVASWNNSQEATSYYLRLTDFQDNSGINSTDVEDLVTHQVLCDNVRSGESCTLGSLVLTLNNIITKSKYSSIGINTGGSFNVVFSDEGAAFYLPVGVNASTPVLAKTAYGRSGANFVGTAFNVTLNNGPITWVLEGEEEDKNGVLGSGDGFNFTLGWSGSESRAANVRGDWASGNALSADPAMETEDDSDVYVEWLRSDLASKLVHYRSSGSDVQHTAEIEYHGGESYGKFFLADEDADVSVASSTNTTTGGSLGEVVVLDREVGSVSSKNLIVVGGSCINSVAANLVGGAYCGAAFTQATGIGSGEALIKSYGDKYAVGKIALLVAGYDVGDTEKASQYLRNLGPTKVDTSAGKAYKVTSATSAEAIASTA